MIHIHLLHTHPHAIYSFILEPPATFIFSLQRQQRLINDITAISDLLQKLQSLTQLQASSLSLQFCFVC